uniref:3-ketoacyl-CoA thiolase 2 peroxisomal-like n=1 Tax=Rhizophora mucronata TaxID=61149 RepID=A0A2P2MA42_RHIMU
MGITSENVAQRYGVTRQEQDQAAVSRLELRYDSLFCSIIA